MNEARLIEKLRAIEALFAGATTPGERNAADRARQRITARLKDRAAEDPPVEYKFTMADAWNRRVFMALLRRYGLKPYRYHGQRYTTVMVKVSKSFVDETLWPEFEQFSDALEEHLGEVTERIVKKVLNDDGADADVVARPKQLPLRNKL